MLFTLASWTGWIVTVVAVIQAFNGLPPWVPIAWGVLSSVGGFIGKMMRASALAPYTDLIWGRVTSQQMWANISRGFNVNARMPDGFYPLHHAAVWGNVDVALTLVEAGADINAPEWDGSRSTALHIAARNGHVDLTEALLLFEADPSRRDAYGRTPLHTAADQGQTEVARMLVNAGADRVSRDHEGMTPADLARDWSLRARRTIAQGQARDDLVERYAQSPFLLMMLDR